MHSTGIAFHFTTQNSPDDAVTVPGVILCKNNFMLRYDCANPIPSRDWIVYSRLGSV